MKFAFLVHPISHEMTALMDFADRAQIQKFWGTDFLGMAPHLHQTLQENTESLDFEITEQVKIVDELPRIVSKSGETAAGVLIEIPMLPHEILQHPEKALNYMQEAAKLAEQNGAELIGLGSMTGIIGGRGERLASQTPLTVTTGNSLTVSAAMETLYLALEEIELDLREVTVAVVGIPGSIATAMARLVSLQCRELLLVGRQSSLPAVKLSKELNAELLLDITEASRRAHVILSATSSGDCIDQTALRPGSIVIDVGVPSDVQGSHAIRSDALILNGGFLRVPSNTPLESKLLWFQRGVIPACLGETIVLALENRAESISLGRDLSLQNIREIGTLAEHHGFKIPGLLSFGRPLDTTQLVRFQKICRKIHTQHRHRAKTKPADLAHKARDWFERHLNPVLAAFGGSGIVKTFSQGEGHYLYDEKGERFLDFVSGFGSLSLGHNSPSVVEAIRDALDQQAPGFAQSAINPYAARLAQQLATIAPGDLELAFFCNSGSEAIEAGLKLARASTERSAFLSCKGGYHGKTLGALSVTANPNYQKPFQPLISSCNQIPFGDYEALERELSTGNYAAFVVEPIQAEGGMHVPPAGYLREAQSLCRTHGTLLLVDEVQTGLGRTGTLFAVEQDAVRPDVMTLAKSLGGGLMPIGAMLTTRELWTKAYGSMQSFALHTTTFGGGSLACAAGTAALEALSSHDLLRNVCERGEQLKRSLEAYCQTFSCLKESRGQGLLWGLEFQPLPEIIREHWKSIDSTGVAKYMISDLDETLSTFNAMRAMQTLLLGHGIYTQVTRSNPLVLRIQPPLTITEGEVEKFLDALQSCCEEIDYTNNMFGSLVGKNSIAEFKADSVTGSRDAESRQTLRKSR